MSNKIVNFWGNGMRHFGTLIMTFFSLMFYTLPLHCALSHDAEIYINEALAIMENHSINKDSIDWDELRDQVMVHAANAQTFSETYDSIRFALHLLGDSHSFFLDPKAASQVEEGSFGEDIKPQVKVLYGCIGYVLLPGNMKFNEAANEYATFLQSLIRSVDSRDIIGWVIDLRENLGGHMWPMIAGLGPFFSQEGTQLGSFSDKSGKNQEKWFYCNGKAFCDETEICHVNKEPYRLLNPNVKKAVLIGSQTMSSGEAVAIALKDLNTKTFGQNSRGLTTCNCSHELCDGAVLWLTQSYFADRENNLYGGKIQPDFSVKTDTDCVDVTLHTAIDWIFSSDSKTL